MTALLEVAIVPIVVALIAVSPALVSMRKFRRENNSQHTETAQSFQAVLSSIHNLDAKVDRVETKIDRHIGEHAGEQAFAARAAARSKAARNI